MPRDSAFPLHRPTTLWSILIKNAIYSKTLSHSSNPCPARNLRIEDGIQVVSVYPPRWFAVLTEGPARPNGRLSRPSTYSNTSSPRATESFSVHPLFSMISDIRFRASQYYRNAFDSTRVYAQASDLDGIHTLRRDKWRRIRYLVNLRSLAIKHQKQTTTSRTWLHSMRIFPCLSAGSTSFSWNFSIFPRELTCLIFCLITSCNFHPISTNFD